MLTSPESDSLMKEFQNEIADIANFEELRSFLNEKFIDNTKSGLKFFFCFSKYNMEDWQNFTNGNKFKIVFQEISNGIHSFLIENTEKKTICISLVIEIKKGLYMFLSDEILKNLSVTLLKWIEYSYPYIYGVHLENKDIFKINDRLKEIYNDIYVFEIQSVIYDPLKSRSQYSSVHLKGNSANENYSEFRKGIKNDLYGKVITRIVVDCSGERGETILKFGYKRKDKSFILYSGGLDYFWTDVLKNCIESFVSANEFFLNRERYYNEQKGEVELSPIVLKFEKKLDIPQLERLVFVFERMKFLSYAINHFSNPYFSASIIDFKDYSTFSINALNDKIAIVPQTRCSSSSLSGIVEEIQKAVGVAEVSFLGE